MLKRFTALLSFFLLTSSLAATALEQDSSATEPASVQSVSKIGDIEKAPFLRLDFNLKGATCVSCIRRISKRLRGSKGVLKADISILNPYEGVVIFDGKKTSSTKLESEIRNEDKRASAADRQLTALSSVPSIVLPRTKTQ